MFKLQGGMNQAGDQRLRLLRETGWRVVTCSRVNSALFPAAHTATQPALGLPDEIWRNKMDWQSTDKEMQCIARKCRMWEIQG